MSQPVTWAYGVTTVPGRRKDLLPRTLASLKAGGFDNPRLFVDGEPNPQDWQSEFRLEVTGRWPRIRAYGNWILALGELFLRHITAQRYALFQDDIVCVKNLRAYLERCPWPAKSYGNLITYPQNQELAQGKKGWYPSNQLGRGAQGLVFDRDAVITLLTHQHAITRALDAHKGWKSIDGGVVTALKKAGYREYVHAPSLLYHTGKVSMLGNKPQPETAGFPGESFDALELLSCSAT